MISVVPVSAFAGSVTITSPQPSSIVSGAVAISASANEGGSFHLEVWDNGNKLGDFFSSSMTTTASLNPGIHVTTVLAVTNLGLVLDADVVVYHVTDGSSTAGGVSISSPGAGSTSASAVTIAASTSQSSATQLKISDNGYVLGVVPANSVSGVYVLPNGQHSLTVAALDNNGSTVGSSNVNFTVAEGCTSSRWAQCDLDQLPVDNTQNDCNPGPEPAWVANPCGGGVQGVNPTNPLSTWLGPIQELGQLLNIGNFTLNGQSLHLMEIQGSTSLERSLPRSESRADAEWSDRFSLDAR